MDEEKIYSRNDMKKILHCIGYDDILTEEELLEMIRLTIKLYKQCRERQLPDCLIMSGLHFAVNKGAEKYIELGGN